MRIAATEARPCHRDRTAAQKPAAGQAGACDVAGGARPLEPGKLATDWG